MLLVLAAGHLRQLHTTSYHPGRLRSTPVHSFCSWRGAGGDHGYDPADANMAALFIANGPDIEPGTDLGTFDNTSVYPLLAKLTGVEPVQGDGDIADVEAALR